MSSPELLRSFIAAADSGSFSAAGRLLGKRQATISGNIARLEDELGVVLFDRVGKYPELTERGMALYDSAKLVVEASERFARNAAHLNQGQPSLINIGIDEDLPAAIFKDVLSAVRKRYPQLKVNLYRAASMRLFDAVRDQQVNLALTLTSEGLTQAYEYKAVGVVPVKLVCSEAHPFASKRTVSNDDLLHNTQLIQSSLQDSALLQMTMLSADAWFVQAYDSFVESLRAGVGWGMLLLPQSCSLPEGLVELNADFVQVEMKVQFDVIWSRTRMLSELESFVADELGRSLKP